MNTIKIYRRLKDIIDFYEPKYRRIVIGVFKATSTEEEVDYARRKMDGFGYTTIKATAIEIARDCNLVNRLERTFVYAQRCAEGFDIPPDLPRPPIMVIMELGILEQMDPNFRALYVRNRSYMVPVYLD